MTTITVPSGEMRNFVLISRAEYERLMQASRFLSRLEAAGVDNWEGYPGALVEDVGPDA